MYPLYESWDIMLLISSYDFDPCALALAACLFLLKDDRRLTGLYIVVGILSADQMIARIQWSPAHDNTAATLTKSLKQSTPCLNSNAPCLRASP